MAQDSSSQQQDEAQLIALATAGDGAAFERLFMSHMPMLFAYCRAICGDYHAAYDAVQDTALVAFTNINRFFPDADFETWLRAIARRRALEARRKLNRGSTLHDDTIEAVYQQPPEPELSHQREALRECLKTLAGRSKEVIEGYYFKGTPLQTLAQELSISFTASKQLLYRARLALGDCMRRRVRQEETV
jgi:RNA polymerase sigma-70 factor (ECF subfamily)